MVAAYLTVVVKLVLYALVLLVCDLVTSLMVVN